MRSEPPPPKLVGQDVWRERKDSLNATEQAEEANDLGRHGKEEKNPQGELLTVAASGRFCYYH